MLVVGRGLMRSYSLMRASFSVLASLLCSVAATGIWIKLARWKHWMVRPRPDRWSRGEAAKFGGLPLLLSFCFAAQVLDSDRGTWIVVALTLLMGLLGLVDDLKPLRPAHKLTGETILAALAIGSGFIVPVTSNEVFNVIYTLIFLIAITNAFNLLDNMDGLAAGVGAITATALSWISDSCFGESAPLTASVAACLAGFLIYNFQRARVFMGDTGSLSLGFFLALSAIPASRKTGVSLILTQSLIFVVPMLDTALVMVTRWLNGRALSAGARDHWSHRLVWLGLSERQAVLALYALAAGGGAIASSYQSAGAVPGTLLLVIFFSIAMVCWLLTALVKLPVEWLSQALSKPTMDSAPRLKV